MDFSKVKGLTIPEGVVTQIADASGRVLWSATIKFTINGDTYIADRGMTWAEWFASDYNTTGETEGDITDANGNEVSLDAVIVGGTVYEVGFGPAMCTVTVTHDAYDAQYFWTSCSTVVDGQTIWLGEGTYEFPIGTVIHCEGGVSFSQSSSASMKIYLNEQAVAETSYYSDRNRCSYEYTLNGNITLDPRTDKTFTYDDYNKFGAIYITEE